MEYVRSASFDFQTGDSCHLQLECPSGAIVVEGHDLPQTSIQVLAHLWEDSAVDADATMELILRHLHQDGPTIRLAVPKLPSSGPWFFFGRGPRVDIHAAVPRHAQARVASRSGRIEVARIDGPLEVEQRSGRTTLRQIGGNVRVSSRSGGCEIEDVAGDIVIASRTGRITVRRVAGSLSIETRTGSVQVERVGGDLQVESRTGRIAAERITGNVRFTTTTGAVSVDDAAAGVRVQTTTGAVRYRGAVRGDVNIHVTTGAIQLEVDPAHPFLVDAETVTGSIRSDLEPRRQGPPTEARGPHVRLRTTTGSIRIGRLSRI